MLGNNDLRISCDITKPAFIFILGTASANLISQFGHKDQLGHDGLKDIKGLEVYEAQKLFGHCIYTVHGPLFKNQCFLV